MSWFGNCTTELLLRETEFCADEHETEVAEGVVVERRCILKLSAAAVATILVGGSAYGASIGTEGAARPDKLTFAQFLKEVHPLARKVVDSKGKDEEAYLMTVAAAMSRLADPGAELRKTMRAFVKKHQKSDARFPLFAVSMRLKPGKGFSHHDHRDYNGVIMGLEGEVRIRNYDILGKNQVPALGKTFQIRETRDDLILPGRFSSLGRSRDNIHDLVAGPEGARVLDVFTFFEKGARSHYLDVEKKPRDADRRIYEAAWKPPRKRGKK